MAGMFLNAGRDASGHGHPSPRGRVSADAFAGSTAASGPAAGNDTSLLLAAISDSGGSGPDPGEVPELSLGARDGPLTLRTDGLP